MMRKASTAAAALLAAAAVAGTALAANHHATSHPLAHASASRLGLRYISKSKAIGNSYARNAVVGVNVKCPRGSFVTGGSANATTIETSISTIAGPHSYYGIADNASSFHGKFTVTAICASGAGVHYAAADIARSAAGESPAVHGSQLVRKLRLEQRR